MAGSTAEITWTSDESQVLRGFQKVEQGFDSIARRMDRIESATKKATTSMESGFDKAAKKVGSMAMALIGGGSLLTAVDMVKRANEEMIRQADEAAKKYDDLFRKFRVQAGLSELGGEKATASILSIAERTATPADVAAAGASGLVQAGFSPQDASGRALEIMLSAQKGYTAKGKPIDTESLSKQASAYFTSQGLESTPANLQTLLQDAFALRAGAFELSDFAELGKQGAAFRGKLSQREQLAAFGTLADAMPAAEAGTSMRNMILKLTAGGRTTDEALTSLGLKREDTDLIGENFGTVLDRLNSGLQSVPETEREPILKKMFEEAGVNPAKILLAERQGKYARYQAGMTSSAADLSAASGIGMSGRNAAEIRQQVRQESRSAALSQNDDLYQAALEEQLTQQGFSPANRLFGRTIYSSIRGLGGSQDQAAQLGYGSMFGQSGHVESARASARQQMQADQSAPIRVEVINQPQPEPQVTQPPIRGMGR